MSVERDGNSGWSVWVGADKEAPAQLVPVSPPARLEVNGAPVVEQSHEFVIRKQRPDAQD
jgi:hypothetical protein